MSVYKSQIEYIQELRPFFNRRDVSTSQLATLLGRQMPGNMMGGMKLVPWDKRFETIIIRLDFKDINILRQVIFHCKEHMVDLVALEEIFGTFKAQWNEKGKETLLICSEFDETEAIDQVITRIDGFKLEDAEGGYLLHQPDGSTVLVPKSELQVPLFFFMFKEFARPNDPKAAKQQAGNPLGKLFGK